MIHINHIIQYTYNTCVHDIYLMLNASYKVVLVQVDPNNCAVPFSSRAAPPSTCAGTTVAPLLS